MKLIKKVAVILVSIFILFWITSLMTGYVIVIPLTKYTGKQHELKRGDTINPLAGLDLNKGKWNAYLVISKTDYNKFHNSIKKSSILKTTDIEVLRMLQKEWIFNYTGGDMATVENSFYLFNDGKLVFSSGIILDGLKSGLQSREYGWLEPISKDLIPNSFKNFKRVYWPIVLL